MQRQLVLGALARGDVLAQPFGEAPDEHADAQERGAARGVAERADVDRLDRAPGEHEQQRQRGGGQPGAHSPNSTASRAIGTV